MPAGVHTACPGTEQSYLPERRFVGGLTLTGSGEVNMIGGLGWILGLMVACCFLYTIISGTETCACWAFTLLLSSLAVVSNIPNRKLLSTSDLTVTTAETNQQPPIRSVQ